MAPDFFKPPIAHIMSHMNPLMKFSSHPMRATCEGAA